MRSTHSKSDYAVTQAIATFTKLGYVVSLPVTTSASYDIVIDYCGSLKRLQVRYFSGKLVELRKIHSSSTGYVIKKSAKNSYDWLYMLNEHGDEFLIKECLDNRRSVTPNESHKIDSK